MELVNIHVDLMIWTIVSFLLVLFVLKKFAWTPILNALEAREKGIKDDIANAKSAREEAEGSLTEYRKKLAEANAEAQSLVVKARQDAERVREELLAKSKEDANGILDRARKQIELESQAAVNQIRGEIAELAIASAEKLISKSLDDEDHRRLVMESLNGRLN